MDQGAVTEEVLHYPYPGSGTAEDPYVVAWLPHDPRNAMEFRPTMKWTVTTLAAFSTLTVGLVSSAYTGGSKQIMAEFGVSEEITVLGVSLFVLGFAIGPLVWAPLGEMFGRQLLFVGTYAAFAAFNAGCAASQNIWTLLICRFLAGSFGASPLTNAGGVIADMFHAKQRGLAMSMFAAAPFIGPVLGPIIGGFLGMSAGWRWVMGFLAIYTGFVCILGTVLMPETYAPVLLRQRAKRLSLVTGQVYKSTLDIGQSQLTLRAALSSSLSRPWKLLFKEPIVLLLSLYMSIVYGTLYLMFAAFPLVYQHDRGWSEGVGGLAFLGVLIGMLCAIIYTIFDNKRYVNAQQKCNGHNVPPEERLPPCLTASIAIPVGIFWFAWTNYPSIHWAVSIAACIPFGFGMVLVFLGVMNYLVDSYTIYAASVLAANSVMRALFGTVFSIFTLYMYEGLGTHWASSIPGFLSLACVPFPFFLYKYGPAIRRKCKYAAEAEAFIRLINSETQNPGKAGVTSPEATGHEV